MNLFNQESFCENTPKLDNNEIIFIAHKLNSIFAYSPTRHYNSSTGYYWRGGNALRSGVYYTTNHPQVVVGNNLQWQRVLWWFYFYANWATHHTHTPIKASIYEASQHTLVVSRFFASFIIIAYYARVLILLCCYSVLWGSFF